MTVPARAALLALTAVCFVVQEGATAAQVPEKTAVFTSGKEGYHTFRIPAVIATNQGTLLAFCEGRKTSAADHGDVDLVLKRSRDGGRTWGRVELVYEEGGDAKVTIGNPCPVVDPSTGVIWLPFCRDNDDVLITRSEDDGRTWSRPVEITTDVKRPGWEWYATGPGVGIVLAGGRHRGRLLIPCDHREPLGGRMVTHSHCIYSDDHGRTWRLGESVSPYTNECQVVERIDGRVLINMRNYFGRNGGKPEHGGMRAVALSADGGHSWQALRFDKALVEPVCQASLIRGPRSEDGRPRLLFSNPASRTTRHRLTVRVSYDEGDTWPVSRLLHEGPAAYSCLIVLPDGMVGCLYEAGNVHPYEGLLFARFSLAWLEGR